MADKANSLFLDNFEKIEDVANEFSGDSYHKEKSDTYENIVNTLRNCDKVFAVYDIDGYEGYAVVVWQKDEKYLAVYGSHCSCYGLENQWEPEETTLELLTKFGYMTEENREKMLNFFGVTGENNG